VLDILAHVRTGSYIHDTEPSNFPIPWLNEELLAFQKGVPLLKLFIIIIYLFIYFILV
jgi:hypothetical protein